VTGLARYALAISGLLLMASGSATAVTPARQVEYLYINASEGTASGGHAAIRFGDQVFHFEHRAPGILVLARDGFERFRHLYGDLENRTIRVSRIPVSEETYDILLAQFARHHLVQRQRLEALEGVRGDRALLEALLREDRVAVEGLGLFAEEAAGEPALVALRARVVARYGPEFIARRSAELAAGLAALEPAPARPAISGVADDGPLPPSYTLSERFRDTSQALAALDVLDGARPPGSAGLISTPAVPLPLPAGEAPLVTKLADTLEESLVRLLDTPRPDWGLAMLVGMARLTALRDTVRTGQWVVLDAFAADAPALPRARVAWRRQFLTAVRNENRVVFEEARTALLAAADAAEGFPEGLYARLEAAANRWLEVTRALDEERPLRVQRGVLLPSRPGLPLPARTPRYDPTGLARALEAAAREETESLAALERDYAYNLVARNCVSEIFREVEIALARGANTDDPALIREESIRRLGGHVEMAGSLAFIPRISALVVEDTYAVAERLRLASYRDRQLAEMRRDENALWVFLRESNVITSKLYRAQPRDSIFLFFTDDLVAPRPLFGAVNLVTGLAASAVGLAMLPVDGGELLWAGLRGALFSLPELVFHNIRKGSFDLPDGR
jgi:hypothetical protein